MPIECVQTDSEVEEFTKRFTSTKEETLPLFQKRFKRAWNSS